MKHWLISMAMIGLLFPAFANAAPTAIKIATEGSYPPFNVVDSSGNVSGYDVDVGNELCKRAKLSCSWVTNEWDSIIPNLVAGSYDAIIADMTVTDERQQTIAFTETYFPPDPSTYLSLSAKTFDYTHLTGLKIGVRGGSDQAGWADKTLKADNTVTPYDNDDAAVADLTAGTIDLLLTDNETAGEHAQESNGALKADGPKIMIGAGAGIGVGKEDSALKTKLNTALAAMKADGWLDAEIRKYFPALGPGPFFAK